MLKINFFCLTILLGSSTLSFSQDHRFDSEFNSIVSDVQPSINIKVDSSFTYLGMLEFEMFNSVIVRRHIFGKLDDQKISEMVAVQFEAYLPTNDYTYKNNASDSLLYGDDVFNFNSNIVSLTHVGNFLKQWAGKGLEHEYTYSFLHENGYKTEDLIISRSITYFAPDVRSECVIVYYKNLSDLGLDMDDFMLPADFTRSDVAFNPKSDSPVNKAMKDFYALFFDVVSILE